LFDYGIDASPKNAGLKVNERVNIIIEWLTRRVYRYINRGLFEKDKITFKLLMSTKILIKNSILTSADVDLLLKAGGGVDDRDDCPQWIKKKTWLNLKALASHKFNHLKSVFFKDILKLIDRDEEAWKMYFDETEPEKCKVPSQY
jgi:dynein heavy chain